MRKNRYAAGCAFLLCFLMLCALCALLFPGCVPETGYSGTTIPEYERKWTTIIYMAADNDLEGAAISDLREMLSASGGLERAGHTVLVLLDRTPGYDASAGNWNDTRLFRLDAATSPDEDDFSSMEIECKSLGLIAGRQTELDMASPETLRALLVFAEREYPAGNYALILWGHGCGWRGYSIDESENNVMSLPQLHEACAGLTEPLSVIAFDCCYGAMLETVFELQDDASFLVATERDEPAAGWNYSLFLEGLVRADELDAEGYARSAVTAFGEQYRNDEGVSVTAVSLNAAGQLFADFDGFAEKCASCIETREDSVWFSTQILPCVKTFLTGEYPAWSFADIESLADCFLEKGIPSCSPDLLLQASDAAEKLKRSLADVTVASFEGGANGGLSEKPLIAVFLATLRSGGVVEDEYPQLYVRGSGIGGQSAFVRGSTGWVPQHVVAQSTSLLDHLYRMPLP